MIFDKTSLPYGCPLGSGYCARQTTHTRMEWRSFSTRVSHRVGGLPTPYWPGLPWAFCSGLVASRDLSVVTRASLGLHGDESGPHPVFARAAAV
ncbi:hypothetical protein J3F84DRAFT_373299 [Trichoderma pleuroticola]